MKIEICYQHRDGLPVNEFLINTLKQSKHYDECFEDMIYHLDLDKRQLQYIIDVDDNNELHFSLKSKEHFLWYSFEPEHIDAIFARYDATFYVERATKEEIETANRVFNLQLVHRPGKFQDYAEEVPAVTILDLLKHEKDGDISNLNGNFAELRFIFDSADY